MIIDFNVTLGNWPFQEFSVNNPEQLAEHLAHEGIELAYVRSCQGAMLPEPEADNCWLEQQLQAYDQLVAVPTINPRLTGWQDMVDFLKVKAVNLYPNYHSYELNSASMQALATKCIATGTMLFITMRMEDIRGSYQHCIVPDVSAAAINRLALDWPELKIVCLNSAFSEAATLTADAANIYLDIAYCECGDTLYNLTATIPEAQIVFGSHTPFFYTRSAIMKVKYGTITDATRDAICALNAQQIT